MISEPTLAVARTGQCEHTAHGACGPDGTHGMAYGAHVQYHLADL
jgi:hypothetical protein